MEWLAALRALERRGFVEPLSEARDFFRLTDDGYQAADRLEGFRRWESNRIVLRAHYFNALSQEHMLDCKGVVATPATYLEAEITDRQDVRSLKETRTLIVEGIDSALRLDWSPNEVQFVDASTGKEECFRVQAMQVRRCCLKLLLDE